MTRNGAVLLATAALLGCTTGEGEGWVKSERLFVKDCWNGPFDLQPSFFGANPSRDGSLSIRVQRGDNLREVSDGLSVLVKDPQDIQDSLGSSVEVALPELSAPAPRVSMQLYLHDSCHEQNGALDAVSGSISFASIFSGDPNESDADDRLTEASFDAEFVNPASDGEESPQTSRVQGWFRFFFQRGQPAQPFP